MICLAIVQSNAMATTDAAQSQYDAVYSICTNVVPVGHGDFSRANGVGLIGAPMSYFQAQGIDIDPSEPYKRTLLKSPKYGEILPRPENPNSFLYHPNEGYLGPDQMTFSVEMKGKILKVIYLVYVDPNPEYIPLECGSGYNGYMIKELPNTTRGVGKGDK